MNRGLPPTPYLATVPEVGDDDFVFFAQGLSLLRRLLRAASTVEPRTNLSRVLDGLGGTRRARALLACRLSSARHDRGLDDRKTTTSTSFAKILRPGVFDRTRSERRSPQA